MTQSPALALSRSQLLFNGPAGGAASDVRNLFIRNISHAPIIIAEGDLCVSGPHAGLFTLLPLPNLPVTLAPGEAVEATLLFTPGAGSRIGIKSASLQIAAAPSTGGPAEMALRGLVTAGTYDEWDKPRERERPDALPRRNVA